MDIIQQLADAVRPGAEIKRQAKGRKAAGKSLRAIGKELGVSKSQVHRLTVPASGTKAKDSAPVRLHPDPAKAARTVIAARGLAYAKQLASAIVKWEAP